MTETVTAIYENGVLRPLRPLKLKERQRVQVRVRVIEDLPAVEKTERERVLDILYEEGLIELDIDIPEVDPVSEEERRQLADILGRAPGKPLSEIVIEERGEW